MGLKVSPAELKLWGEKGLVPAAPAKPKPPRRGAAAPAPAPLAWSVTFEVPCVVRSEMNARGGWQKRYGRAKKQQQAVRLALVAAGLHGFFAPLPCRVTLARLGGRPMDGDNLAAGFKAIRDEVARLVLQVDDADPRVAWACEQRAGATGVVVTISGGGA